MPTSATSTSTSLRRRTTNPSPSSSSTKGEPDVHQHLDLASDSTTTVSTTHRVGRMFSWDCLSEDCGSRGMVVDSSSPRGAPKAWFPHNSCEALPSLSASPKGSTTESTPQKSLKVVAADTHSSFPVGFLLNKTPLSSIDYDAATPVTTDDTPPRKTLAVSTRTLEETSHTSSKVSFDGLQKFNTHPAIDLGFTPLHRMVKSLDTLLDLNKLVCVSAVSKLYWGSWVESKLPVVVKVVAKSAHTVLESQQLQREFEALCFLHKQLSLEWHQRRASFNQGDSTLRRNPADSIVKPIALLETDDEIAFVSERLEGPDLCQYLIDHKRGKLTENEARRVIQILLDVLDAIHRIGFVHRDVKLPNLVLKDQSDLSSVTLVDFGFAARLDDLGEMCRCCGSPGSCAPEVLMGQPNRHGGRIDVFSLGVVLYTLLTGVPPFYANCPIVILRLNCRAEFDFDDPIWLLLSTEAKDFVVKLTQRLPGDRLSISAAQRHPWIILAH